MKNINPEDIANILNVINGALEDIHYQAVGFDATGEYLTIMVDEMTQYRKELKTDVIESGENYISWRCSVG